MKKLLVALALCAGPALAQQPQLQVATVYKVKFVPPPELGAKPNRPGASADNAYTLHITVQGLNATTKQPWTLVVPARSYAIVSPRDPQTGLPTGHRQHRPVRFTFHKSSLQDGVLGGAVARGDDVTTVKLDFKPVAGGVPGQYIVVHELGHASLENVDEYVEATFGTYKKLTWTWIENQKPQVDEWTVPPPK